MFKQTILRSMMSLLFLSSMLSGNTLAATNTQTLSSAKPGISIPNPQLRGKVTQDNLLDSAKNKLDLRSQQPKADTSPQTLQPTGKIKRHALWDVYESTLSKTDDYKRVPQSFLNIETVFRTLKKTDVDESTKRFLSFLVKNWGTFTSKEDPPPLNLSVLGENIWAVAEQSIPVMIRTDASQGPNKAEFYTVDANNDGMLTREELIEGIRTLDAVPNDLKIVNANKTFNYFRLRATINLLLDSFDMFDAQTNSAEYKYL